MRPALSLQGFQVEPIPADISTLTSAFDIYLYSCLLLLCLYLELSLVLKKAPFCTAFEDSVEYDDDVFDLDPGEING